MNKEESKKSLFDLLICNYDFPVEFAEDMAKFLTDEGYTRPTIGAWVDVSDSSDIWTIDGKQVFPKFCSNCGDVYSKPYRYCPTCGAKMSKED